jgi:signal transduction histidine kinase
MTANEQIATLPIASSGWMKLARAGWYVCAAIALGIFILAVPALVVAAQEHFFGALAATEPSLLLYAINIASFLTFTAAALISCVLAGVLFLKRPEDRMALFIAYFLLVYGVVFAGPLASFEYLWPGARIFVWSVLQPLILVPLLIVFLSIFPDGSFVPSWTRWLVALAVLYALVNLFVRQEYVSSEPAMLSIVRDLFWYFLIFGGLYGQVYRYRSVSSPTGRQQTKWVVFGLALALLLMFLLTVASLLSEPLPAGSTRAWAVALGGLGWSLAIVALPLSLTFAMMRYRLWDIDIIINRTLVYSALTVSVVVLYVLVVGGLGALLQAEGNPLISLVATGLIAFLFQSMREYLQRGVNRLFYGQRDDPLLALSQLGKRLEAAIAPEVVLPTLVETIAQTLKLPYVAISLRTGDEFKIAAQSGDEVADALNLPLNYQGETVGQLLAGPRRASESFSQADRQLLQNIAHQAGPAAYAVQLTRDLRRSRVHLVTAREAERRRLRRDLHDGLGPVLASQGLKIAAVGQLLQDNPDQARRLLEELAAQNEATVAEIRRLVYELRPAALDDMGLVGAVRDYASGLRGGAHNKERLRVDVQASADSLPPLPAAIEVAAYRIATEALTNVARHARARHATVSFTLASGNHSRELHLEIVDDGVGLPENQRSGIGLISMRERADEVGGHLLIESSPGQGTRVLADLPFADVY